MTHMFVGGLGHHLSRQWLENKKLNEQIFNISTAVAERDHVPISNSHIAFYHKLRILKLTVLCGRMCRSSCKSPTKFQSNKQPLGINLVPSTLYEILW